MTENPYEPPRIDLQEPSAPVAAARFSIGRVLVVATSIVATPLLVVATYAIFLRGMLYLHPHESLPKFLSFLFTAVTFIGPLGPALFLARAIAQWINASEWWDAVVLVLSVAGGIAAIIILFG